MLEWESTGSPLISAVASKIILTPLWLSKLQFYSPRFLHLHGDYPHQAFPADSIKTHQTAYTVNLSQQKDLDSPLRGNLKSI